MTYEELGIWMKDNEELRHQIRDENIDILRPLVMAAFISPPTAIKQAFYAGYLAAQKKAEVPASEVPQAFKDAFKDE
jgi:hypothetical protein